MFRVASQSSENMPVRARLAVVSHRPMWPDRPPLHREIGRVTFASTASGSFLIVQVHRRALRRGAGQEFTLRAHAGTGPRRRRLVIGTHGVSAMRSA